MSEFEVDRPDLEDAGEIERLRARVRDLEEQNQALRDRLTEVLAAPPKQKLRMLVADVSDRVIWMQRLYDFYRRLRYRGVE